MMFGIPNIRNGGLVSFHNIFLLPPLIFLDTSLLNLEYDCMMIQSFHVMDEPSHLCSIISVCQKMVQLRK